MYIDQVFAPHPLHPLHPVHPADLAVFLVTTTLCALGALMLPLAG
jgi:hypothetical protein